MAELLLGVNIDHIATLRNARYRLPGSGAGRVYCRAGGSGRHYRIYVKIAVTLLTATCASCVRRWIPA